MPDAAEVVALVLEFDHRRDARKPGQALDEWIFDRHAERLRKGQELRGRKLLLAEKNHAVFEPRVANFLHDSRREFAREIDVVNFRADGGGDFFDFHLDPAGFSRSDEYTQPPIHPQRTPDKARGTPQDG